MTAVRRTLPALLALPLLLAGCGGSGTGTATAGSTGTVAAAGGTTASSGPASGAATATPPASSSAPSSWGALAGCPSVGRQLPPGARSAPTVDVDGDGRPDTEWIQTSPDQDGGLPFGARTASGAVLAASIQSASPVPRSVMFADVTGRGEVIALASDGRQVLLYAVSECQLIPMRNAQGQQYAFDLGFTGYGTGVGCVDVDGDGTRELVGLKLVTDAQGNPTAVQRTVVELDGPQARNGATSTVSSPTPQQAELARSITCGPLTMKDNGVTSGP